MYGRGGGHGLFEFCCATDLMVWWGEIGIAEGSGERPVGKE
ncbi:MAG: hypothetical protein ACE5D4_03430 [Thermodesulfobacteriota bacterium]